MNYSYHLMKDWSYMNYVAAYDENVVERGILLFRYVDYRTPPWDENPYVYTATFWHVLAAQFLFVVAFEVTL